MTTPRIHSQGRAAALHPLRLLPCALAVQALCLPAAQAEPESDVQLAHAAIAAQQIEITGTRFRDDGYTSGFARSATRLDLSLRETPQAVTVFSRELVQDLGLGSVQELLKLAPGVTVERVETDRSYYTARGFQISNFQVDGVGLPFATGDQLGDLDTALYERVEVLRGANGLMSFTGNPSATVNFIRKRPTAQWKAGVAATAGSWRQRRLEADVSGPLAAEGRVRGRVVAATEQADSYLDRYSQDKRLGGVVLDAQLGEGSLLTVGASQQDNRPQGVMWGALPLTHADGSPTHYPRSASTAPRWTYWDTRDRQLFAEFTQRLGAGWQGKLVATRRDLSSDSELFYVYGAPDRSTGEGVHPWPSKYGHRERQTLLDATVNGPLTLCGRRHEVVLGLNASRSENTLRSSDPAVTGSFNERVMLEGSFPRPEFTGAITGQGDFTDRRRSAFAVVRWSLADTLSVITGVNSTDADSRGEQYGEPHTYRLRKTNPYLGLVWDFDAQHSLYASHAGIFNPQNRIGQDKRVLPPIEGRSSEVGLKGEWLGGKLNGALSLFRVRQDHTAGRSVYVPPQGGEPGYTYYVPEDATSTGVEMEVGGRPLPGWELTAGLAQMRLKTPSGDDARRFVPRRTAKLATSVRVPALPALKLGGALKWQDDTANDSARQKAYTLVDLMASYDISPALTLAANLRNVTNTRALTSLQWDQAYAIAPRHGSLTLTWRH